IAQQPPEWPITADDWERAAAATLDRSEEHTSELQSRQYLVCRLLLEKTSSLKKSSARQAMWDCASRFCEWPTRAQVFRWIFFRVRRPPLRPTLFPYTTLFR